MKLIRHSAFLRNVFFLSFTSFGGAPSSISMMMKIFVQKRKDISEKDLIDMIAFCNMLPGASSSQVVALIAHKRGGIVLAALALLIWMSPACILMGTFAIALTMADKALPAILPVFKFVESMVIGFTIYAGSRMLKVAVTDSFTKIVMSIAVLIAFVMFKMPVAFPLIIVVAGVASNFVKHNMPHHHVPIKRIRWGNIIIFASIFITLGLLSEIATQNNWKHRKVLNVMEASYRMGSAVFGGAEVLIPTLEQQFVARPTNKHVQQNNRDVLKMSPQDFFIGASMIRLVPGPMFSITAFTGGMVLKEESLAVRIVGALLSAIFIFTPSFFLAIFFFPVWENLKRYSVIHKSLRGISAAVVGIMFAASFFLLKSMWTITPFHFAEATSWARIAVLVTTVWALQSKRYKISPPYLVVGCLLLGFCVNYFR